MSYQYPNLKRSGGKIYKRREAKKTSTSIVSASLYVMDTYRMQIGIFLVVSDVVGNPEEERRADLDRQKVRRSLSWKRRAELVDLDRQKVRRSLSCDREGKKR